jgi:hypothetical protein
MRALGVVLVLLSLTGVSCKDRPVECQRLRQCCAKAQSLGDVEEVRVACTRKEDDDAVICLRRLEEVQRSVPQVAMEDVCRAP